MAVLKVKLCLAITYIRDYENIICIYLIIKYVTILIQRELVCGNMWKRTIQRDLLKGCNRELKPFYGTIHVYFLNMETCKLMVIHPVLQTEDRKVKSYCRKSVFNFINYICVEFLIWHQVNREMI